MAPMGKAVPVEFLTIIQLVKTKAPLSGRRMASLMQGGRKNAVYPDT